MSTLELNDQLQEFMDKARAVHATPEARAQFAAWEEQALARFEAIFPGFWAEIAAPTVPTVVMPPETIRIPTSWPGVYLLAGWADTGESPARWPLHNLSLVDDQSLMNSLFLVYTFDVVPVTETDLGRFFLVAEQLREQAKLALYPPSADEAKERKPKWHWWPKWLRVGAKK